MDYSKGKGSNVASNIFIQNAKIPAWSTLFVDFGVSRKCFGALGLNLRTSSDLGKAKDICKGNIRSILSVNINGKQWKKALNAFVVYENGFEGFILIDEQSLMNALMQNEGEALITLKSESGRMAQVVFSLRGSASAISGAHQRYKITTQNKKVIHALLFRGSQFATKH